MEGSDGRRARTRVAIVGTREDGGRILEELLEAEGVDVIGASGIDSDGLEPAKVPRHDVSTSLSIAELLQRDPDVVIDTAGTEETTSEILDRKSHRTELIGAKGTRMFMNLLTKRRGSEEEARAFLGNIEVLYNLSISLMRADTLDVALNIILDEALRILKTSAGSISLFDTNSNTMTLKTLRGFPESFSRVARWSIRPGGMTEHILNETVPTVINDVNDFEFANSKVLIEAGVKSLIAVPFWANGKRVGILYIDDYEPRQWTSREVDFLIMLSVQAAAAIEKFKLIEEITETRTYLENVLDNSADIIVTTDSQRRIVEFNKGASRVLGYSREEMVGKPVEILWVSPEKRRELLDAMRPYGFVSSYETQIKTRNGSTVDVSLTLSYLNGIDGRESGTVGVSKDITERKRLERALEERNRELQELNEKLEAKVIEGTAELREANRALERSNEQKSKFIATMSHELRTPLNAILGFSELLMSDALHPLTEKQKRYAANVYNSGTHLLQLINNILDLAKIESGKMELSYESFPVSKVVSEVESVIKPLLDKKKQRLIIRIAHEVSVLRADRVKFKQILYNLLSNAVKFSHDGGDILTEIEILRDPPRQEPVDPTGASDQLDGGFLLLSVMDAGIGIRREDQDRIFGEFVQVESSLSRRYEGTGLGLSLTRKLVELHGGEIRVESEEGRGSTFTVVMPLTDKTIVPDSPRQAIQMHKPLWDVPAFKGRREGGPLILVVEDDLHSLELMTLYLVESGYRVAHAYNGETALSRIRDLMPFAVILDIMLPGKDGWEILQEIKSNPELKEIPVIISSIIDNNALGFALGASDYMVKPVDRNGLLTKLKELSFATKKNRKTVNILCIDDDDKALEVLRSILEPAGYEVSTCSSGREGIESAIVYKPDLIILDLMMPDVDGFEVTRILKDSPATMDIPILILTAKDITVQERLTLAGKIVSYMQKKFFTKEDLLMHMRDLELTYPARAGLVDEVSGLLDYSYFQIRLAQEVSRAKRYKDTFTLLMVDLDCFTEYMAISGMHQANICIRKIAEFLKRSTRGSDTIVRYGMDEFAVILSSTVKEAAVVVARRILAYIGDYPFFGEELLPKGKLTASIAMVNCPRDAKAPEEIVAKAHEILRRIKESGGGRIELYGHEAHKNPGR